PRAGVLYAGYDRRRDRERQEARRVVHDPMAATSFRLRIVTPERLLLDEEVEEVTAPGVAGEFGVLPDHITFLTTLAPGRLIYRIGAPRHVIAIFGGYAEGVGNLMTAR